MAAGLKDIALRAGLSVGTVSDILNRGKEGRYNPETCEQVRAISREYQYRPHHAARAMRAQKSRVVGFAAANFTPAGLIANHPIFPFIVGLNHRLCIEGYHVGFIELAELEGSAHKAMASLDERFFDAMVIHYGLSDRATRFAGNLGLPLLWWDSGVFESHGCVYRDEREVTLEVMRRLIDLGHRRIAIMAGETTWRRYSEGESVHYSYVHRLEAYGSVMRELGEEPMPVIGYDPAEFAAQLAKYKATAILIQGANASTVTEAMHLLGRRVPEELSIASLDIEARIPRRGLAVSGMIYDRYEAGRQAGEIVLSTLNNGGEMPPSVKLKGEFEMGRTIAPAPR